MKLRLVKEEDAKELLAIYQPYVENTTITFEYSVPTVAEFVQRIKSVSTTFPYLVAEEDGIILGYGYIGTYRGRIAYQWTVETSVYVSEQAKRKGIGKKIYNALLALAKELGYYRAYACITYPNPPSIAFHQAYGFKEIGIFEKCGYKFDTWLDVMWLEYIIQEGGTPTPPKKMTEVPKQIIQKYLEI